MRWLIFILTFILAISPSAASRIKDITTLEGIRDNQLIGYGLVVGLDGTGDKTNQAPFTDQSFRNMLLDFGVRIPQDRNFQLKNVAAVAVFATLPPFGRIGQKIDITVSSLGNATSLRGGSLLLVPLKGADNHTYAMAQGNVVVSGMGAQGSDGSRVSVNSTATGRIPNGATIEQTIEMPYIQNSSITLELNQPDFTTSQRIAETINEELGYPAAEPLDAGAVKVRLKKQLNKENFLGKNSYVNFISDIENLTVEPGETPARIIINSRSGTIVVGKDVAISSVAVAHGNLSVSVSETPFVSQPQPFGQGRTVTGSDSDVQINQQKSHAFLFKSGTTLKELVDAINKVGATPTDLIVIFEAIKQSGALHADLEVM